MLNNKESEHSPTEQIFLAVATHAHLGIDPYHEYGPAFILGQRNAILETFAKAPHTLIIQGNPIHFAENEPLFKMINQIETIHPRRYADMFTAWFDKNMHVPPEWQSVFGGFKTSTRMEVEELASTHVLQELKMRLQFYNRLDFLTDTDEGKLIIVKSTEKAVMEQFISEVLAPEDLFIYH